MRLAHIHFIVSAPNYKPIITQILDRREKHIKDASVLVVKESLVVDFLPKEGDPKADFEMPYDFRLATFEEADNNCQLERPKRVRALALMSCMVLGDADAFSEDQGAFGWNGTGSLGRFSM